MVRCHCSENPNWRQNIAFVSFMVKVWALDLGQGLGKTRPKAEFLSGAAVNEVVLKGSWSGTCWPQRCSGKGAGQGRSRGRVGTEEEASAQVLMIALYRMIRCSNERETQD